MVNNIISAVSTSLVSQPMSTFSPTPNVSATVGAIVSATLSVISTNTPVPEATEMIILEPTNTPTLMFTDTPMPTNTPTPDTLTTVDTSTLYPLQQAILGQWFAPGPSKIDFGGVFEFEPVSIEFFEDDTFIQKFYMTFVGQPRSRALYSNSGKYTFINPSRIRVETQDKNVTVYNVIISGNELRLEDPPTLIVFQRKN